MESSERADEYDGRVGWHVLRDAPLKELVTPVVGVVIVSEYGWKKEGVSDK